MELHQMSVQKLTEKLEKAERELAVAVIENADLRERMSSLESLYRARDKDCAAKDAELERVRSEAQMLKRLVESLARHNDGDAKVAYLNVLGLIDRAALASPEATYQFTWLFGDRGILAEPATDTDVDTKAQQLDIEDQIKECK